MEGVNNEGSFFPIFMVFDLIYPFLRQLGNVYCIGFSPDYVQVSIGIFYCTACLLKPIRHLKAEYDSENLDGLLFEVISPLEEACIHVRLNITFVVLHMA